MNDLDEEPGLGPVFLVEPSLCTSIANSLHGISEWKVRFYKDVDATGGFLIVNQYWF